MTDEESVFSRWSRRKRSGVEEEKVALVETETAPVEVAEPESEEEEAALLEQLGLPVPESLGEGDDFAPFMKAGVPEFLRKRALRVLWRSNPVLANLDGLNDYDDDFNSPELTQKVLATGYQVGRGFARRVVEAIEGEEPEVEDEDAPVDNIVAESESNDLEEPEDEVVFAEPEEDAVSRPRRMRFET